MKNKDLIKRILAGTLIISLSLSFCGCKKKKKQVAADSGAYSSVIIDVPVKEGFSSMIRTIFPDGENTCIPVEYSRIDEETGTFEQVTEIYTVDNEGKIMSTLSLPGVDTPIAVLEEGYAYVGVFDGGQDSGSERLDPERTISILDKKNGKTVKMVETEFAPHFVISISDGYVITGSASISRYAKDWSLVKTFQPGFSLFIDGENFFEDKGKFYAIEEKDMGRYVYHEVDFESGACPALAGNQDIGASGADMSG
ncbi:MAG: hypothetical protein J5750_09200, partial [Clostridiales bacterium]|nr:hypothetical protein [Clostridiales bacterium]